jgi:hypothetical protein
MMAEEVFHPKSGDVCRWLLRDDNGAVIGRVAAFMIPSYVQTFEQPTGGMGFFECIDSQDAAFMLFDTAVQWLKEHGAEAADGPINTGENFFNWGLLTDGFMPQGFGMPYNPPYYQKFFEDYGFQVYYTQYSYYLDIADPNLPSTFWKVAERVYKNPSYRFEHFRFARMDKYINDFLHIYEQAWGKHENHKQVDPAEIGAMLKESKLFLEEDFIWFVYRDDEPVAFLFMTPDLNQLFRHIPSGRLNLWGLLKIMWLKKRKAVTRSRIIAMGVIPKYQKNGIESAIFYQLRQVMLKKTWYKEIDLSWVGDFNPKMMAIVKRAGGWYGNTHLTYRYLFDRTKEFKRAAIITD